MSPPLCCHQVALLLALAFCKLATAFALGNEPSFDSPEINVTVVAGQSVLLPCLVDNLGKYKIAWLGGHELGTVYKPLSYEDRLFYDDERFSVQRPTNSREWNLRIENVRHADTGTYRCTVNTSPPRSKVIHLYVKVPAAIIDELSSNDVSVQEGETVPLVCNVTGIPHPTVTWFRRPTSGLLSERERLDVVGEVVIIQNVSRFCDDIYECVANNGILQPVSRQIRVSVQFAPEVQLRNQRMGQQLGRETILDCFVTAYPQAEAFWEKDGRRIMSAGRHRVDVYNEEEKTITLSLRIHSITAADFGQYRCQAANMLGKDERVMSLYEIGDHAAGEASNGHHHHHHHTSSSPDLPRDSGGGGLKATSSASPDYHHNNRGHHDNQDSRSKAEQQTNHVLKAGPVVGNGGGSRGQSHQSSPSPSLFYFRCPLAASISWSLTLVIVITRVARVTI